MKVVLNYEDTFSVSRVGPALEADKEINLAFQISVIARVAEAAWATAQRRTFGGHLGLACMMYACPIAC